MAFSPPRTAEAPRGALRGGVAARRVRLAGVLLAVALALAGYLPSAGAVTTAPEQIGQWGPIVSWPTMGKHMILLPNGNVLVFSTGDNAHVWNPRTDAWIATPATFGDLHCAGHVTLADGRAMVVGGVNVTPFVGIKVAAIFDHTTNTWANKTPMSYARWYPTITTLPDGRVLAANGTDQNKAKVLLPEVYDPGTDTWTTLTGASRNQPIYSFMYVLPNGKVYDAAPKSATAYLDVAGAGSWSAGPTSGWDNSGGCCSESGAMYGIGKIIRSGGNDPAIARTNIVDMTAANPLWQEVAPMAFPRRRHTMVILADGSVMAVGGTRAGDDANQAVLAGEIWNPDSKTWATVDALSQPRMYHSAAFLLPDGRVVAAGGDTPDAGKKTAQIYSPPYLFNGPRPVISSSPANASYGSTFTVGTDAADVASVALIRPAAVTHAIDMNQRYVPLTFTQSGTELTVTAPSNGNVAPPGAYMLVIKNSNGVPSVASWLTVGGSATSPPPPPTTLAANFTASTTSGDAPLTVAFADTSTGSPESWEWDFQNDGVVDSAMQNPQFQYLSAGSYTVKLTVRKAGASDDEIKVGYISVTVASQPAGTTVTFSADADARVQEANATTNYGTSYLRADGGTDPDAESYLRFTLAGLTGTVTSAKLRVYATSGTANGPAVYTAGDNGWSESGITWSSRPVRTTTPTADKGSIAANSWVEFDVTSLVSGNGTKTFVLATNSSDGVDINSREASTTSLRPQLVVTQSASGPTLPTADYTASPVSGVAPLTVQFTDKSTGAKTWAWDFENDDSFESTAQNPLFTYAEPGSYTVRLQVENDVGGDEEIKTGYITVGAAPPPGATLTFQPVADAKVRSSTPDRNYGTLTDLQVRREQVSTPHTFRSYLKFTVTGLSGPATSAKLRLYVTDPSKDVGTVHAVSSSWTETGIAWSNAPPIGVTSLASARPVTVNAWLEIDLGSAIAGNGDYSFALKEGTVSDSAFYSSREGTNRPQLVVTADSSSLVARVIASTFASVGPTPRQARRGGAHHHH